LDLQTENTRRSIASNELVNRRICLDICWYTSLLYQPLLSKGSHAWNYHHFSTALLHTCKQKAHLHQIL